jgi:hypothetical protein
MALKDLLMKQGMKLMQDPRFMKLMSDERVMRAVMNAMQLRGKIQESFDQRVERVAKTLNLATQKEVKELKRTLRKMERELEEAKKEER